MAIRYIKDDGYYFYIVTEKGQKFARAKNGAKLLNTTEKTWTIQIGAMIYVYDENNNLVQSRFA